jgi:cell division protein FtsL
MAKDSKDESTTKLWLMALALGLIFAAWAYMSTDYLMATLRGEREFAVQLSGQQADQWIYQKMIESSLGNLKEVTQAARTEGARQDVPVAFRGWIQERIIVTWLWGSLIMYRLNLLLLFWFILMPFIFAIAADGFYTRAIRTFQFSSQSPIRHRMGVVVLTLATVGAVIWVILPMPLPSIIAPLMLMAIGFSTWMWTSNLQKRI